MDGDGHHGLEAISCGQNWNFYDEDAPPASLKTLVPSAPASVGGGRWENQAGGPNGRCHARGIADFLLSYCLEDLLADALLDCLVEVRKIGRTKILPLGVLAKMLLMIGLHAINVSLRVIANAGIVAVGADDDVLAIAIPRPRVWPAAAVASKEAFASTSPRGSSSSRPVGQVAATWGVLSHRCLCLIGVCTDGATTTLDGCVECLG